MDVVRVNQVEGKLDAYIARADKRHRRDEGERPAEEIEELELARRLYRERIVPACLSFAGVVGDFLDKAGFRVSLAWAVLLGRLPL